MRAMTGRTSRSAVTCGLLVGLCLCESVVARPRSLASEPGQNQTEFQDVEALRVAAEQGDAEAQRKLGLAHLAGNGVDQDDAEALRWFRLAAVLECKDLDEAIGYAAKIPAARFGSIEIRPVVKYDGA